MLKIEILRGLITEKLTIAVREILSVVETTVSGYEKDVLLLKQELSHYKRQLDATLQPQVRLKRIDLDDFGTSDVLSCRSNNEPESRHDQRTTENRVCSASDTCQEENGSDSWATKEFLEERPFEHEEKDSSTDLPSDSSALCSAFRGDEFKEDSTSDGLNGRIKRRRQLPARYRLNLTKSDDDCSNIKPNNDDERKPKKHKKPQSSNIKRNAQVSLRVGLLKNSPGPHLSQKDILLEVPVQTILCQENISKSDFIKQLRSTFPELGEKHHFDAFLTSSTNTSAPYYTNKMTHDELYKVFRSQKQKQLDFYLQKKEHEFSDETLKNTQLPKNPSSNILEEETLETQDVMDPMKSIMNVAPLSETSEEDGDDDDDLWKPVQNDEEEGCISAPDLEQCIRKRDRQKGDKKSNNNFCKVCSCLFRSWPSLTKHALSHLDNPKCMCGICGQQSDSPEELKIHLETHQKLFKCDTCGQYFLSTVSLKKHKATHNTEKLFKCNICRKLFGSNALLKKHQLKHHNNMPYKCDICSQSFNYKSVFERHMQIHTGDKPYCCEICGKSLADYRSLCQHKLLHSGEKNYSCQICGKKFYTMRFVKRHAKIHTIREKKYLCDICSKTFLTKQELWLHQQRHNQSHVVKCPLCSKLLKGRPSMEYHMRTHTGERPFVCSQCDMKFRTQSHLSNHIQVTHVNIKHLTCSVCGYKCARKHYLDSHMRIHTGHKPYKCTLCDKAFTQSHCLKTHMKSHKAEEQPHVEA